MRRAVLDDRLRLVSFPTGGEGELTGSAGCNRYSGTFTVSGSSIQISSPLASMVLAIDPGKDMFPAITLAGVVATQVGSVKE